MNQIKAEADLKERTKAYVKYELDKKSDFSKVSLGFSKRSIRTAVFTTAALAFFAISGFAYYNHPISYVSLDINPSVELSVNAFNLVINSEGINNDGKSLIRGITAKHVSLDESIESLILEAEKQKFIAVNGSTVIAVTAISKNDEKAIILKDKCEDALKQAIEVANIDGIVYADYTNLETRSKARELGIPAGKYKMIEILKELDSSTTFAEYKSANITSIIIKANEILLSAANTIRLNNKELIKEFNMIKTTAAKINNAEMNYQIIQNLEKEKIQTNINNDKNGQSGITNKSEATTKPGNLIINDLATTPEATNLSRDNGIDEGGSGNQNIFEKNDMDSENFQVNNEKLKDGGN
jgi:hypothetical protein